VPQISLACERRSQTDGTGFSQCKGKPEACNKRMNEMLASAAVDHGVGPAFGLLSFMLGSAVLVGLLLHRFRQSLLIGYFLCGVVIGPGGLVLVADPEKSQLLSEIGVVLLMFTLGIEFSFSEMKQLRRIALRAGGVQMGLSALLLFGPLLFLEKNWLQVAALAAICAVSSTAVVLKVFQESSGAASPASRVAVGVAVFQDIAAILFMVLLPALFGSEGSSLPLALAQAAVKGVAFLGAGWILSRFIVPQILDRVSRTQSRELFTLCVLALCAGIAWLAHFLGLSLALGAFAAGLIVSETVFSHRILSDVLPFKDFFLTVFFVSVGMMVDLRFCLGHLPQLLLGTLALIVLKTFAGCLGGLFAGFPVRHALVAGLGLSSIGEFAFVLLTALSGMGGVSGETMQMLITIATLSMAATPALVRLGPAIGARLEKWPIFATRPHASLPMTPRRIQSLNDHAVICGYGIIGQGLNETLHDIGIPTLVIELNAETVKNLVGQGQPCLFADAARKDTFELAGLERAKVLAVTIPHFEGVKAAIVAARELNPGMFVIARARYPGQVQPLREAGANVVINEEAETSFEILRRTLQQYDLPRDEIDAREAEIRFKYGVEN